jgi:hypothetical protein
VFNTTFNNISVILWRAVLLEGGNHWKTITKSFHTILAGCIYYSLRCHVGSNDKRRELSFSWSCGSWMYPYLCNLHIITKVVSSNPTHGDVYSIQLFVIVFHTKMTAPFSCHWIQHGILANNKCNQLILYGNYLKAGVICCIDGKMTCMNDQLLCNWYIFVILLI